MKVKLKNDTHTHTYNAHMHTDTCNHTHVHTLYHTYTEWCYVYVMPDFLFHVDRGVIHSYQNSFNPIIAGFAAISRCSSM